MTATQLTDTTKLQSAVLVRMERITPPTSSEDVRHLVFHDDDPAFTCRAGQCIRILAPGQDGNRYHPRMYLVADNDTRSDGGVEFSICVRRHSYIDDFNGERYPGVASNYLCDLKIGEQIEFAGSFGYPFEIPADRHADLLMIGMGTGIAPFRAMIREIYEKLGSWDGKVRLFYGARSGLEMLYMNEENVDLAQYVYQPTFQAFRAISPRPAFDAPVAIDQALTRNAAEVWEMLQKPTTHLYLAGVGDMQSSIERALGEIAGSASVWSKTREAMRAGDRWHEVLY